MENTVAKIGGVTSLAYAAGRYLSCKTTVGAASIEKPGSTFSITTSSRLNLSDFNTDANCKALKQD